MPLRAAVIVSSQDFSPAPYPCYCRKRCGQRVRHPRRIARASATGSTACCLRSPWSPPPGRARPCRSISSATCRSISSTASTCAQPTSGATRPLLLRGLPFSLTLLTILLAHEFGHYLACRLSPRGRQPALLPAVARFWEPSAPSSASARRSIPSACCSISASPDRSPDSSFCCRRWPSAWRSPK